MKKIYKLVNTEFRNSIDLRDYRNNIESVLWDVFPEMTTAPIIAKGYFEIELNQLYRRGVFISMGRKMIRTHQDFVSFRKTFVYSGTRITNQLFKSKTIA